MKQQRAQSVTAVFPGSFDPLTRGHVDVVERLNHTFSKVIVLIAESSTKTHFFSVEERIKMAKSAFKTFLNVSVVAHSGLTVDFAKEIMPSVIVRSLRGMSDFDYERTIAEANRLMNSEIDTYFIFGRPEFTGISSTLVKEIAKHNGNLKKFVTPEVEVALKKKSKLVKNK